MRRIPALWLDERAGRAAAPSQTERVRVCSISLAPGERIAFHRHQLDYFWTALTAGRALSIFADGRSIQTNYKVGMTRHFQFVAGEFMVHDLKNVGRSDLAFLTVEFLSSANLPLPVG